MTIHVLSPEVASKIAAGEVTERPASVVKELVENSLDAGATKVAVGVHGGGIEYIRVTDDGAGIARDEVTVAFERFATSKLDDGSDLESVVTFGFRGEALPSIAAVSRVTMVTRTRNEDAATRIDLGEGELLKTQSVGAAPGTAVTVRGLFRNIPARRKFLRSAASEATRIQAVVSTFALARPDVSVSLTIDGVASFTSGGFGDLREAVAVVYSPQVAEVMLSLEGNDELYETRGTMVTGLIGAPSIARSNRNHITIFVNGRWVQNRSLTYALQEAYRGFLMERRYPVAVVNIAVPHSEVDVNVHPSKTEVRLQQDGQVFATLQRAVRQTLTSHLPVQELSGGEAVPSVSAPSDVRAYWPVAAPGSPELQPFSSGQPSVTVGNSMPAGQPELQQPSLIPHRALPALRVLGQIRTTYIAAEGPDGMYLIDQHAAHERVLFEQIKAETGENQFTTQGLIEPWTVDLTPEQIEIVEVHSPDVEKLGFEISGFGGRTFVIRGVPSILRSEDPGESLRDVLDLMVEGGGYESWRERAAYSLACHGAIRAGKVLTPQETSELVRQLEQCSQPHTCPHGRPTMIHLSAARLEEEFGRRG